MKKQTMTIDEKLNSVRAGVLGSNDGILKLLVCSFRFPQLLEVALLY